MLDKSDLINMNGIYWDIKKRGHTWESYAESLSKAYYACEDILNNKGVVDEKPFVAIQGEADLAEEDTIG